MSFPDTWVEKMNEELEQAWHGEDEPKNEPNTIRFLEFFRWFPTATPNPIEVLTKNAWNNASGENLTPESIRAIVSADETENDSLKQYLLYVLRGAMLENVVASADKPSVEWADEVSEELTAFVEDVKLTEVDSADAFFGWFALNGGSYELVSTAWGNTEDEGNAAVTLERFKEEYGSDSPLGLILSAIEQ